MSELNPTTIMTAVLLTWGIGLAPPLLLRYAILKRPMEKWPAIGTCAFFWFINFFLFTILSGKIERRGALILVSAVSYWILRKTSAAKATPGSPGFPRATAPEIVPAPTDLKQIFEQYRIETADIDKIKAEPNLGDISEFNQMLLTNNLASTGPATTDGDQHATALPTNGTNGSANKATPATDYQATIDEDRVYHQIAEELETGATDKGMWTRLFAECGGDEKQTKVLYIKQRADRLISAERLRLEQAARQQAAKSALLRESVKVRTLSSTPAAVTVLDKVRLSQIQEVSAMLDEEPLLVAVFNSDGDTPLHIAVREKHEAMARFLLNRGAIIDVKNNYHVTPLEYAKNSRQIEMVKLLTALTP